MLEQIRAFGALEKGFSILPDCIEIPENLTSRDLWNAWNTTVREGTKLSSKDFSLRLEDVCITIQDGCDVAEYYLLINREPMDGLFPFSRKVIQLKNNVLVLWDPKLTVRHLRGAIL